MNRPKIGGPPAAAPWCWYTREMLFSPAFRGASINCRRLIDALEAENMSHAGTENGNLVMPYRQLEQHWHVPHRLVRRTIDEAMERGLIEERRGLYAGSAKSVPNRFRLTFRPTREGSPPRWIPATNEWQRYRPEPAEKICLNGSHRNPRRGHIGTCPDPNPGPQMTLAPGPQMTPLSISRVVGRGSGPARRWRARHAEALAYHRALHPKAEAAGIAWGELQIRWHRLHGERVAEWTCAGCREPIGGREALALTAMGLQPPADDGSEDAT